VGRDRFSGGEFGSRGPEKIENHWWCSGFVFFGRSRRNATCRTLFSNWRRRRAFAGPLVLLVLFVAAQKKKKTRKYKIRTAWPPSIGGARWAGRGSAGRSVVWPLARTQQRRPVMSDRAIGRGEERTRMPIGGATARSSGARPMAPAPRPAGDYARSPPPVPVTVCREHASRRLRLTGCAGRDSSAPRTPRRPANENPTTTTTVRREIRIPPRDRRRSVTAVSYVNAANANLRPTRTTSRWPHSPPAIVSFLPIRGEREFAADANDFVLADIFCFFWSAVRFVASRGTAYFARVFFY